MCRISDMLTCTHVEVFSNSNDQGFVQSVGLVALRNLFYLALGLAHAAAHFSGTGNTEIEEYEPMGLVLVLSQWYVLCFSPVSVCMSGWLSIVVHFAKCNVALSGFSE